MGLVMTDGNRHLVRANIQLDTQKLEQLADILGISRTDPILFSGVAIHIYLSARPAPGSPSSSGPAPSPGTPSSSPGGGAPPSSTSGRGR